MGSKVPIRGSGSPAARLLVAIVLLPALVLGGCVTYSPQPTSAAAFRQRLLTEEAGGVRVSLAALGRGEARKLFGVSLADEGIQPVWLEIANDANQPMVFFQQTIDPNYFAPAEAAAKSHFSPTKRLLSFGVLGILVWPLWLVAPFQAVSAHVANRRMDALFQERGIGNRYLEAGEDAKGFVFTHLDEGSKSVDVGLLGPGGERRLHFLAKVPGLQLEQRGLTLAEHYAPDQVRDVDREALRAALAALPCCVTNKAGDRNGDPLNLVVIGSYQTLLEIFVRAGWDQTEALQAGTSLKTAKAFLLGSSYRYSPVSSLYLFSRAQDVAFQKARETIHQRNHLRLWLAPMRFQGMPVWVGQVSRDIGVKFTLQTWNLTTHVIDSDIDDSRENVVGDLLQTRRVAEVGYVPGVGASDPKHLPTNLTGDAYRTDGYRAVIELAEEPVAPQFLDWGRLGPAAPPMAPPPQEGAVPGSQAPQAGRSPMIDARSMMRVSGQ